MADVQSEVRPYRENDDFLDYMLTTKMEKNLHIPCYKRVLSFQADDTAKSAFKMLSQEGFLSAPILDGTKFLGFITTFDLMSFICSMFFGVTEAEWTTFWDKHERFNEVTCREVMGTPTWRSKQSLPEPMYTNNSTFHAVEALALGKAHRLIVLNNRFQKKIENVFTHSMFLSELRQRLHLITPGLKNKPISAMTNLWQSVVTINKDDKAINAFNKMKSMSVNGLAIVDDAGVLQGTISTRDIRGIGNGGTTFSKLFLTVTEYKAYVCKKFPLAPKSHYPQGKLPLKALYLTPNDTFVDVVNKMRDGNIHRVWVCDQISVNAGAPIPTKVITQTDILQAVLDYYCYSAEA